MRDEGNHVEVSVEVAARPETVFRCLAQSDLLSRWLAAKATIDARVGGAVRVDFERYGTIVEGEVVELVPGERLSFTWGVTSGPQVAEIPEGTTRVTISLAAVAGGTLVTLRHAGLASEKARRDHEFGWKGYLGQLAQMAPVVQLGAGADALVDAWFAAWAETDAASRALRLAGCFDLDGTFRDTHADLRGRAAVDAHIAACQVMFPGVRLVRDGAVMQTRDALLVRWNAVAGNGAAVATGFNHFRLAPGGGIAAVEGFWA